LWIHSTIYHSWRKMQQQSWCMCSYYSFHECLITYRAIDRNRKQPNWHLRWYWCEFIECPLWKNIWTWKWSWQNCIYHFQRLISYKLK
jgi:hypothetical protein